MRRTMVEELAFAEVAALRKLKVWTTAINNLRSSQEMRSTRAGPTGCSIFATGRCEFLVIAPLPFRLRLIHFLRVREGHGRESGAFRFAEDNLCNPE